MSSQRDCHWNRDSEKSYSSRFVFLTRMHSSRMRTVRSSGRISGGGVPGPGRVYLVEGGVPGPGGCTWFRGGVPGLGGVPGPGGVYLVPGGVPGPWEGAWSLTPPPPCGQTHACKNITFATSMRTVMMHKFVYLINDWTTRN